MILFKLILSTATLMLMAFTIGFYSYFFLGVRARRAGKTWKQLFITTAISKTIGLTILMVFIGVSYLVLYPSDKGSGLVHFLITYPLLLISQLIGVAVATYRLKKKHAPSKTLPKPESKKKKRNANSKPEPSQRLLFQKFYLSVMVLMIIVGVFFFYDFTPESVKHSRAAEEAYHNGDHQFALIKYNRALEANIEESGPDHPDNGVYLANIGIVYTNMGKIMKALEYLRKAVTFYERISGPDHPKVKEIKKEIRRLSPKI